jgi:lipoyl(octanoyl) transferase
MAINISTDLAKFDKIVPCGIGDFGVTSMKEIGIDVGFEEFDKALEIRFDEVFG